MDTKRIDFNLLVALDVLIAERNVTKAARRLNLSQPALSAQLNRLRDLFSDQLLIPAQRGMIPTHRALELQEPLRQALEGVRSGARAPLRIIRRSRLAKALKTRKLQL
jgi:DNA-binding transcriptional LysR family regulator